MLSARTRVVRSLTQRAKFSAAALTHEQYPFLARLGIQAENKGCWDGKEWRGSGETITSMNPSTGEPVANVQFGNNADYEQCLKNMEEVRKAYA